MILTGVHRNPDLMITQAYREISPASGRIWALAALAEAYFDKYEVWKWTEVHVNDLMLVETFSSGRKCKNSSWSNSSGHLPRILGTSSEVFGKSLFSEKYDPVFFLIENVAIWGKISTALTQKKKNWQHCKFSVYLRFYRGRLPMSKKQVYILTAAAE